NHGDAPTHLHKPDRESSEATGPHAVTNTGPPSVSIIKPSKQDYTSGNSQQSYT
ncbi:hypothetical protein M9458_018361, partial [Cirrhinus mrigala]